MLAVLELFVWIDHVAGLNIETMSPARRVACIIVYGAIGLGLAVAGIVSFFDDYSGVGKILVGVVVTALGAGFLARIAYGLVVLRRMQREAA